MLFLGLNAAAKKGDSWQSSKCFFNFNKLLYIAKKANHLAASQAPKHKKAEQQQGLIKSSISHFFSYKKGFSHFFLLKKALNNTQ